MQKQINKNPFYIILKYLLKSGNFYHILIFRKIFILVSITNKIITMRFIQVSATAPSTLSSYKILLHNSSVGLRDTSTSPPMPASLHWLPVSFRVDF